MTMTMIKENLVSTKLSYHQIGFDCSADFKWFVLCLHHYQFILLQNFCHCKVFRNVAGWCFVSYSMGIFPLNGLVDHFPTAMIRKASASELLLNSMKSCTTEVVQKVKSLQFHHLQFS